MFDFRVVWIGLPTHRHTGANTHTQTDGRTDRQTQTHTYTCGKERNGWFPGDVEMKLSPFVTPDLHQKTRFLTVFPLFTVTTKSVVTVGQTVSILTSRNLS